MKKSLLFLFMLTLFVGFSSCSSDDEEDNGTTPPEYYNPVEGEWLEKPTGDFKQIFSKQLKWSEMKKNNTGGWEYTFGNAPYTIDKDVIKSDGKVYKYKIVEDILELTYPNGDIVQYSRSK